MLAMHTRRGCILALSSLHHGSTFTAAIRSRRCAVQEAAGGVEAAPALSPVLADVPEPDRDRLAQVAVMYGVEMQQLGSGIVPVQLEALAEILRMAGLPAAAAAEGEQAAGQHPLAFPLHGREAWTHATPTPAQCLDAGFVAAAARVAASVRRPLHIGGCVIEADSAHDSRDVVHAAAALCPRVRVASLAADDGRAHKRFDGVSLLLRAVVSALAEPAPLLLVADAASVPMLYAWLIDGSIHRLVQPAKFAQSFSDAEVEAACRAALPSDVAAEVSGRLALASGAPRCRMARRPCRGCAVEHHRLGPCRCWPTQIGCRPRGPGGTCNGHSHPPAGPASPRPCALPSSALLRTSAYACCQTATLPGVLAPHAHGNASMARSCRSGAVRTRP